MIGPLLSASATALARMIRTREVAREVVEAHISRAERVNPVINAIVHDRYAEARTEADAADARVATGDADALPPFFGVPFTIKECLGVRGLRRTWACSRARTTSATRTPPRSPACARPAASCWASPTSPTS